ncbi:MAG: 50S ribosomal protein L29 [Patescibacteria group bacterium]
MKAIEIRKKDKAEIEKSLYERKEALRVLRSNLSGSKSKNVKEALSIRKDIARMLTELNVHVNKAA